MAIHVKAICICTTGRLDYVRACLESLSANDTTGWHLYASMEPGFPEVHDLVRNFRNGDCVNAWINGRRLGPELNTFVAHFSAINDGAEAVLYFDDDMVLSPDAIQLCNWYLDHSEHHDPATNAGLCLCARRPNLPERPNSVSPNDTWQGMVGQGYLYTRDQWFDFVKRNFWVYYPHFGGDGYDWALAHRALDLKKTILRPRLSRSKHIGAHGFHGGGESSVFPDVISTSSRTDFVLESE